MSRRKPIEPTIIQFGNVFMRVVPGRKSPTDLRLDIRVGNGNWEPLKYNALAFMVECLCDNEDRLYPPELFEGGDRLLRLLNAAADYGWDSTECSGLMENRGVREAFNIDCTEHASTD